jgi:hypothetical protein
MRDCQFILLQHARPDDPYVGCELRNLLNAQGFAVEWHQYPMPNSVCPEDPRHVAAAAARTGKLMV